MGAWKDFEKDPFGFVDRINLTWKGKDFNIFHDDHAIRRVAIGFGIFCFTLWMIQGFDSSPLQLIHVLYEGVPGLVTGQLDLSGVVQIYNNYYGKEMHYSAFVIYVGLYVALSFNWARVGVTKTKNVIYSFAAMFLAIGLFEWFWMASFATFQQQPWVLTWRMPQLKIILQNTAFTLAGGLTAFYIWVDSYVFVDHKITGRLWRYNCRAWKLWILIGLSVASALFWIYYPGPVEQISVTLADGQVWQSSRLFPQTLYTINLDPGGLDNSGVWFYVQNDLVHLVNTGVKLLWALTAYTFFKVRKEDGQRLS